MTLAQFKALFDQYYSPIKNFVYYKCGDVDLAEDVTQDAFMKLWEKREEIKEETVKSYLYTIANNMFLNKVRHDKVVLGFVEKQTDQINEQSPEYALEEKEFKAELERVIAGMTVKQREVFLMNRIDDLTYKEIAERLELSVKAVEKRMHGALNYLKEKIHHKI
jgi:RNA polymerase sigma-70 factor (family 1)